MKICQNCGHPLELTYCASCGQKDIDLTRPLVELIHQWFREWFDVDGRASKTIVTLFGTPGALTNEFLMGRRASYTSPVRLYLVISVVFFLVVAWLANQGLLLEPGQTIDRDAAIQASFTSERLPKLMFILLPAFAFLLKLLYWKRRYMDHLIFSLHIHSALYLVLMFMLPLEKVASQNLFALIAQLITFAYLLGYFVIAAKRVYSSPWPTTIAKSLVSLFGYMIVLSVMIEQTSDFQILSD